MVAVDSEGHFLRINFIAQDEFNLQFVHIVNLCLKSAFLSILFKNQMYVHYRKMHFRVHMFSLQENWVYVSVMNITFRGIPRAYRSLRLRVA